MKKLLTIVFILAALVGIAGFWYLQRNQYSKEILKLEILGKETVQAGDEIEYLVKFKNNGEVRLENPVLRFEYPKNSVPQEGNLIFSGDLEDIYPGEERVITFKARVFGKENDRVEAKAYLTYQPKNLKARYESKTSFVSEIKFVPLTFEFDLPLKSEAGEEIEFSLNYFSNINYVLENLRIQIEYPSGFHLSTSQPKALDGTEWDLRPLNQANGGRIVLKGTIEGEEGEQRIFRAKLGIFKDNEFLLLKETAQSIEIITPTLYISQLVNGSQNYIANPGDLLHYEVFFRNIGKKPIQKKFLFVTLEGELFDPQSLKSEKGEIGRGDSSILWDWKEISELNFLDAGEEGKVGFWVKVKLEPKDKVENPSLVNKVSLAGAQRVFETKVNSAPELLQKVYFEDEVFGNSGSLPPEVGKTTTYTVFWQVKNLWNDLRNVKVKSQLPENVSPTGKIFPEGAKFTFDSQSREIIWSIGDLESFQGREGNPLTLVFQIAFTPDSSQKGTIPLLVKEAEILGEDVFTSEILSSLAEAVNAALPHDDKVNEEEGVVK